MRSKMRIKQIDDIVERLAMQQEMNKKQAGMKNDIDGNNMKKGGKIGCGCGSCKKCGGKLHNKIKAFV
jgi:hypothetical protein